MQHCRPLAVIVVVFSCLSATVAQARSRIEFRKAGGKTITCQRKPKSNFDDCGFQPDWPRAKYDYIFVGSISAVSPYGTEEMKLQISPEEVFLGEPANPLIVLTSQSACQSSLDRRSLAFLPPQRERQAYCFRLLLER